MAGYKALIWYGDGLQALCYGEQNPKRDKNGVLVIPLLVVPSIELSQVYSLTEQDLTIQTSDGRRGLWVDYPENHIEWLRRANTGAVIFVWCAFDRSNTTIMRKPEMNFEKVKIAEQMEDVYQRNVAYLIGLVKDFGSNQGEILRTMKDLSDAAFGEAIDENKEEPVNQG
jgi:hypothetical protein